MTAPTPMGADPDVIEMSIRIKAAPSTVFHCLTDAAQFSHWIGAPVSFHGGPSDALEIGGSFRIAFSHGRTIVEGGILELTPNRRLQLTWGIAQGAQQAELPAGSTIVTFDLEPDGAATRLRLRHEKLPNDDQRADHRAGWADYLRVLKSTAERE